MLASLPAFLFYPALLLWCVVYGVPAGVVFMLAAIWENWVATVRYHYILWKKYPQRSYQKYISSIWANQIRDQPLEMAEYTRLQVEKRHPQEPFPFVRILANTVLMVCLIPYLVVTGLIKGPLYVYHRELQARRNLHRT